MMRHGKRSVLRLARSAPAHTLDEICAATSTNRAALSAAADKTLSRGRCVSLTRRVLGDDTAQLEHRVAAAAHRALPPPMARTCDNVASQAVAAATVGTAVWTQRDSRSLGWHHNLNATSQPRIPTPTLRRLCDSRGDNMEMVRRAAAASSVCPPVLLTAATSDTDSDVRAAAVEHPGCDAAAIAAASTDSSAEVRETAARHRACPPAALAVLASDPKPAIHAAAMIHPDCPTLPIRLQAQLRAATDPDCDTAALNKFAHSANHRLKLATARHPNTTPRIVAAALR